MNNLIPSTCKFLTRVLLITCILPCFSLNLYSQCFKLNLSKASVDYSVDRIDQQVYYTEYATGLVKKVNLRTMEITPTEFTILSPTFSNKQHLAYHGGKLYDLERGTYLDVISPFPNYPVDWYFSSFSPNDSNLILPYFSGCFSLKDSIIRQLHVYNTISADENGLDPEWTSDTSFIYYSYGGVLIEHFLGSQRNDTLVSLDNQQYLYSFSYNREYKILAYSDCPEYYPRIHFHYSDGRPDSLIFDPERDCDSIQLFHWNPFVCITSLAWSPDCKSLAFIGYFATLPISDIHAYKLDSNKVYCYTGDFYEDGGLKYNLSWANNDTVVFENATFSGIYGLKMTSPYTSVKEERVQKPERSIILSNYPNPFNSTTTFHIKYEMDEPIKLKIYNVLGEAIKTIHISSSSGGIHKVSWDGTDNYGNPVSSGIYLAAAETPDNHFSNNIKVVLIK